VPSKYALWMLMQPLVMSKLGLMDSVITVRRESGLDPAAKLVWPNFAINEKSVSTRRP